jgi:hypothetical protein
MCQRIKCARCGRPTWIGCGAHVEQILSDVPPAERCQCKEQKNPAPKSNAPR